MSKGLDPWVTVGSQRSGRFREVPRGRERTAGREVEERDRRVVSSNTEVEGLRTPLNYMPYGLPTPVIIQIWRAVRLSGRVLVHAVL